VLQRFGQSDADLSGWGDGDGQVPERFIGGAVRGDPVPGGVPSLPPAINGEPGIVEVMTRLSEPLTALNHMHPINGWIRLDPGQHTVQMLQPLLLGEPFGSSGIPFHRFGCSAGFTLRHTQRVGGGSRQTRTEGGDRRRQPDHVTVLGVTGQPILVSVADDDRTGPPRTGLGGQRFLTGIEPIPAHLMLGILIQARIDRFRSAYPHQI
jgi:hypothetical protein